MKTMTHEIVFMFVLYHLRSYGMATPCRAGFFGRECLFVCHCAGEKPCDDTSGRCANGCADGWTGASCQRENIAFRRRTSQKSATAGNDADGAMAVDDNADTCTHTRPGSPGWWSVTLDNDVTVNSLSILTERNASLFDWKVYVGTEDSVLTMDLCTSARVTSSGATLRCDGIARGSHVMVVNRAGQVNICDFRIYKCSPFWFGTTCDYTCNCKTVSEVCDSVSGACVSGCAPGWSGMDCQTVCMNTHGADCRLQCGHCADDKPCDHVTGTCQHGCQTGWTGIFCNEQCSDNSPGPSCQSACGHCYGVGSCNVTTGNCIHGCEPGYMGGKCLQTCTNGTYGVGCKSTCGHCVRGTACDVRIGVCEHGCEIGWTGAFCTQECASGKYGLACLSTCPECYHGNCDKVTGRCQDGCAPGLHGDRCLNECVNTHFGINCSGACGHCKLTSDRICDIISGECLHGCKTGYNGRRCDEVCPTGFYGDGCMKCGVCVSGTVCDPFTGRCPRGCVEGFIGDTCHETKPFVDEDGPQLKIFLGLMLTMVAVIMSSVTFCLVLIWRREHLPDMTSDDAKEQVEDKTQQNGCLLVDVETTTDLDEM